MSIQIEDAIAIRNLLEEFNEDELDFLEEIVQDILCEEEHDQEAA